MGVKTPPYANYPAWTEARFWAFIRSGLRSMWSKWPPKFMVLKAARRDYKGSNKRLKYEFQCAHCSDWFPQKQISVDHVVPAGTLKSFDDVGPFLSRLLVAEDKLQCLCKTCHDRKTKDERKSMPKL